MADLLGFYDANGLSMRIQQIVGVTVALLEGKLLVSLMGLKISRKYQEIS